MCSSWLLLFVPALADEPAPAPVVEAVAGRGVTVTSADGDFAMNLRARLQVRATFDALAPDAAGERDLSTGVQLRTARLYWSGHVLDPHNQYVVQLAVAAADYRDGTLSPVFDAYLDFDRHPNVSVRIGQMLVPFDRLRTIREFALQLTERPRPVSELTLDRDVGLYVYSDHLGGPDGVLSYRLGVFGGRGTGQLALAEPGGLGVARLALHPMGPFDSDAEGDPERRARAKLMIGAAAAYNANTTRQRSTTGLRYAGGTTSYLHLAADAVLKVRGFALQAEYVSRRSPDVAVASLEADAAPVLEATQSGSGVIGQASYAFGERHEIVGRYSRLSPAAGTDPTWAAQVAPVANEVAAGTNVYLNGHRFKVQLDWIALFGEGGFDVAQHTAHTALDVSF